MTELEKTGNCKTKKCFCCSISTWWCTWRNTEESQWWRRRRSYKLESQLSSHVSLSFVPHCNNPSAILWLCGWILQHEPVIICGCPSISVKLFYEYTQRTEARNCRKQKFLQLFPFKWNSDHLDSTNKCFSSDCSISSILGTLDWGQSWDSGGIGNITTYCYTSQPYTQKFWTHLLLTKFC